MFKILLSGNGFAGVVHQICPKFEPTLGIFCAIGHICIETNCQKIGKITSPFGHTVSIVGFPTRLQNKQMALFFSYNVILSAFCDERQTKLSKMLTGYHLIIIVSMLGQHLCLLVSRCGTVGIAVASDSRGHEFE